MSKPSDSRAIARETPKYTLGAKPEEMWGVCVLSSWHSAFSSVASGEGQFSDMSSVFRKDKLRAKITNGGNGKTWHPQCMCVPVFPLAVPDNSYPPPFLVQQKFPIPAQTRQAAATLALQRRCASNRPKNTHGLSVIHKNVQTEKRMPSGKSK